jgi:probable DNA metabolism protein
MGMEKSRIVFTIENSAEGIYSALYQSFVMKVVPDEVVDQKAYQPKIDDKVYKIRAGEFERERVKRALKSYAGQRFFEDVELCFLSNAKELLKIIFRYGYLTLKSRKNVVHYLVHEDVYNFNSTVQQVASERDNCARYLQFCLNSKSVMCATFNPKCDVLEISAPLLFKKFGKQPFYLKDAVRDKIAISNGEKLFIAKREKGKLYYTSYSQLEFLTEYKKIVENG